MISSSLPLKRGTRAFSLVEVTLALGVAAFCLLSIFGLLPIGLNSNQLAIDQTTAASCATRVIADLRATALVSGSNISISGTSALGFTIPGPAGTASNNTPQRIFFSDTAFPTGKVGDVLLTSGSLQSLYRVDVGFTPPPTSNPKSATTVRILVTWPALANKTSTSWPTNYNGSFESVTALNRN